MSRLESKLLDQKAKEDAIVKVYRKSINLIKRENYSLINSETISRNEKHSIVSENNKKVSKLTKKIAVANMRYIRARQIIHNERKNIQKRIRALNKKRSEQNLNNTQFAMN